jgi:hypothetical protein
MIFVNTVAYAHLRLLHSALPIASACALCSVSKACLSAEDGHTLVILFDTIVLASTIIVNRASLHAVGSIAPALLVASHWNAVPVFIDTVVCASKVRDIAFLIATLGKLISQIEACFRAEDWFTLIVLVDI